MSEPKKEFLGGIPVGAPGYTPGPEHKQMRCSVCPRWCWIGPRQQQVLLERKPAILCMICAVFMGKLDNGVEPIALGKDSSGAAYDEAAVKAASKKDFLDSGFTKQGE
jgi:hypothetical protein